MPKLYELGLPNSGRRTVRLRSSGETVTLAGPPPSPYGSSPFGNSMSPLRAASRTAYTQQAISSPRSPQEEEAELQRAIRMSLAESEAHLSRQKSYEQVNRGSVAQTDVTR